MPIQMAPSAHLNTLIDQLIEPQSDQAHVFSELEILVEKDGVSLPDLSSLLGIVFEPMVSSTVRNRILDTCLIPDGTYHVPADVILRVLGSVGAPEIYYKNGKQHKSKRFSLRTQQRILQWTINTLPFLGQDIQKILRRSLPVLFGLLSYEFSRPYIATLIIVATTAKMGTQSSIMEIQNKHTKRPPLRSWHVELVADLLDRFPLDASLRALMLHFSRSDNTLDIRKFSRRGQGPSLTLSAGGIAFPDADFPAISRLQSMPDGGDFEAILGLHHGLSRLYQGFERSSKKRRIDSALYPKTDLFSAALDEHQVPISNVNSVQSLIANFEKIKFINPSSVFSKAPGANHKYRCLYVSSILLSTDRSNSIYKKLSSALQHHVLSDLPGAYANFVLETFAQYGTIGHFKSEIETYMEAAHSGPLGGLRYLKGQLRVIPFFHLAKGETVISTLRRIFSAIEVSLGDDRSNIQSLLPHVLASLSSMLHKFGPSKRATVCEILESFYPQLYDIMDAFWSQFTLLSKLGFLMFMNTTVALAISGLSTWNNAAFLIPPPSLMFKLVVSTHPLVVSEALGFIAAAKKLKLVDDPGLKSALKNAYVMDSINFVWRDMAFKHEPGTINQGMYLHPQYLQRMSGLDFFSNSNLISTKSVGGIVQNPAFAYACAEIVWKLEDSDAEITTRHPGPISEDSVAQLQQEKDVKWLSMNFLELKVSLLNHLDAMGFHGLADLLFTSLKPLLNRRKLG